MIYLDLILNLALLVAISVVSGFIEQRWSRHTRRGVLMQGFLFGGAAVIGMLRPLNLGPGLIFDGRSVMVSLCALFYGPWATALAGLMPIACRVWLGGMGTFTGVLVILSSAAIGLLARLRLKPESEPPSTRNLYLLGLTVHLTMLALMLTLPGRSGPGVVERIGLPVMLLYPLATILTGKILSDQVAAIRYVADLQRARQNLEITLDSIGDAVISTDRAGRIVLMNPVAEILTGWGYEEARGKPLKAIFRIINAETRAEVENPVARVLREGMIVGLANHTLLIARDGRERQVADSAAPIRDGSGEIIGVVLIFRDVTTDYQTRKELQESEELFRNLFENHAAVKLLIDPDTGGIVDANRAAESFYGWPHEQLTQMRIQDINTLSPAEVEEAMEKVRTQKRVYFEFRHRRADGSIRDIDVYSSKIVVRGKELLHSVIHDATERKRAEAALRESEGRYRSLFMHAPDAILVEHQDRVILVNEACLKLFGARTIEELIGKSPYDLFHPDYHEIERERIHRLRDLGEAVPLIEEKIVRLDGESVDVEVIAAHFPFGDSNAIHVILHDISKRKQQEREKERLQAQLLQAQKMEAVGRLAGGVAHDYNNMLSVILGYAELALDEVAPEHPLHSDLEAIYAAANRSKEITRQLLAFGRRQTIAPKVIDLNETVEGMLRMLERLIGENIDLAWWPAPDLWPVKMDPVQVDQILANLCVNARDAIADVGKITIETGNAVFDEAYCADHAEAVPGEYVMLAVSDDGHGMDREVLDKIFEPFFTTKENRQGIGLGLATVYGIVKQNNGFINVYSEPEKGTTFRIYLPRHAGQAFAAQEESTAETQLGHSETVLLVEDDVAIMKLTGRMLEELGYSVLTANTPSEVMRLIEDHAGEIHLLMTDVVMPEMNGRDLVEKVRATRPEIKCLFMSGYTANVIAHRGVLDEGVQFIQKPFSKKELAVKVRAVLDHT